MSPRATSAGSPPPDLRVFRVAALTLANAMLFQEVLSATEPRLKPLRQVLSSADPIDEFTKQWQLAEKHPDIDFVAVFKVAREILLRLPSTADTRVAIETLANAAIQISTSRAALRHDLMGRIFHRLLSDPKYFGACYTKIPSATMLLTLAFDENDFGKDWSDPHSAGSIKATDLACGTGTLLKTTLAATIDKHIENAYLAGNPPNPDDVQRALVEEGLWGFDVLASAIHLAAVAIAMHNPAVRVNRMRLYTLPLGGPSDRLGSIEFANSRMLKVQTTLIGGFIGAEVATSSRGKVESVTLPDFDLVTMNPPFTRSVFRNLLFGSFSASDRKSLQRRLQQIVRKKKMKANITAGLGSVFVALADGFLKNDGVLALVLPKAVLEGSAWAPTREIFDKYQLQYVITSQEPGNWNFSEATNMSEVLLVLKKTTRKQKPTIFVNLWTQPRNSVEALNIVRAIRYATPADITAITGVCELGTSTLKYGEMNSFDTKAHSKLSLGLPAAFAQTDLCRSGYFLSQGKILLPGQGTVGGLPLVRLSKKAELGPDGRDVYDGFDLTISSSVYQALWGHNSSSMSTISQTSNQYLIPLVKSKPTRKLRNPNLLWSRAGSLMLPKELRLTTNCLAAVTLPDKALSNVWWPTRWKSGEELEKRVMERRLALWFNSTLGLFTMLTNRQETEGSWVKFPKDWFETLDVLDLSKLDTRQLAALDALWPQVSKANLLPFPQMDSDPIRKQIDDTFSGILGIPSVAVLRRLLAREPIISMRLP